MNISIKIEAVPFIKQLSNEEKGILLQALCEEIEGREIDLKDKPNVNMAKMIIIQSNKRTESEKRFRPPTLEEVREYCKERNNNVDPEKFISYYEGANWYRGKTKIKDWKACVRTWERNTFEPKAPKKEKIGRDYDFDDLEKKLFGGST